MSGGKSGGRGYLVQALVCLLESLHDPEWVTVKLEPDAAQEKVDICWTYSSPRGPRVAQVKSREGASFGKKEVTQLLRDLKKSAIGAEELELHLVGPVTSDVAKLIGKTSGTKPSRRVLMASLVMESLYRQAATGVEELVRAAGFTHPPPPQARIDAFKGLVTELLTRAHILGTPFTRVHLQAELLRHLGPPDPDEARRVGDLATALRDLHRHTKLETLHRRIRDVREERRRAGQDYTNRVAPYLDAAGVPQIPPGQTLVVEAAARACDSTLEEWINAYEDACAAFLDGSVDPTEFIALLGNEVKELFTEDGEHRGLLEPRAKSPFKSLWATYDRIRT